MADEEILFVVIRIDEPGGDAFGVVGANIAGIWVEYIDALDPHTNPPVLFVFDVDGVVGADRYVPGNVGHVIVNARVPA
jgi:hypothetical protein